MGDRSRNTDRADPLRKLLRTSARWQKEILQRSLCQHASRADRAAEGNDRREGSRLNEQLDLNALCEQCGELLPKGSRSSRRYCSDQCQRDSVKELVREARAGRPCEWCGDPIPDTRTAKAKYCCKHCQEQATYRRRGQNDVRLCQQCGNGFAPKNGGQAFCSPRCAAAAVTTLELATCAYCGIRFRPKKAGMRHCCRSCSTKDLWARGILRRNLTATRFNSTWG